MAQTPSPNAPDLALHAAIHLMDSALGRPIRSWQFSGQALISIGRVDNCDVQISDPYVSRNHAELQHSAGQWLLVSLGRHGVLVQGETITEVPVQGETTFRLGSSGPTLRFDPKAPHTDNRMTMMFEATVGENLFELDHSKLEREVSEIADGDYFLELQRRAKQLRDKRT